METTGDVYPESGCGGNCTCNDENTVIKLGECDSALVLRANADGVSINMYIPHMDDPEEDCCDTAVLTSILAARMNDQEFVADLYEWFNAFVAGEKILDERDD